MTRSTELGDLPREKRLHTVGTLLGGEWPHGEEFTYYGLHGQVQGYDRRLVYLRDREERLIEVMNTRAIVSAGEFLDLLDQTISQELDDEELFDPDDAGGDP